MKSIKEIQERLKHAESLLEKFNLEYMGKYDYGDPECVEEEVSLKKEIEVLKWMICE
jgi:hypothetical protein